MALIAALAALLAVVLTAFLLGSGILPVEQTIMFVAFMALTVAIARQVRSEDDPWLPSMLAAGLVAKLAGASARYLVLFAAYDGTGDAVTYHLRGIELAEIWREFAVPSLETAGFGSQGTRLISIVTGLLYAPYEPTGLGGFWIFAFVAFVGQVFFYLAFRQISAAPALKRYGLVIFFWPTLVYWPSSIGKEAFLILLLGLGTWAVTRLYRTFRFIWLLPIGLSALLIASIRVHVGALFVGAVLVGALFGRGPKGAAAGFRRLAMIGVGLAAMIPLVLGLAQEFGVSLAGPISVDDLEPAFSDIEAQTGQGGSAVSEGAIRSPADIPAGVLKVLFRPFPNEAENIQMLLSSAEGALLLGFILWRGPQLIRNGRRILRNPYLMMCTAYTLGFIFAWSAINNLGIMARQRSLLLPYLLVLVVAVGWKDSLGDPVRPDLSERLMALGSPEYAGGEPPPSAGLLALDRETTANRH